MGYNNFFKNQKPTTLYNRREAVSVFQIDVALCIIDFVCLQKI